MFVDKQRVLYDAPAALNRPDQPWVVTVEGENIVARWKWMDAVFFAPNEITDATKAYSFVVTLKDNGKWKEQDITMQTSKSVGFEGGTLKIGGAKQAFSGHSTQKSFEVGLGKNKQDGNVGLLAFKFDTQYVKEPIRAYLTNCGWKKGGLFG